MKSDPQASLIHVLRAAYSGELAAAAGRKDLVPELLQMAQVERQHEAYFRGKIEKH